MLERYSRQTLFGPIGKKGQERLGEAKVTIIGCGALGTVLANNLCRAGVGHLVIADRDYIELNNLQRQILFDEDDVAEHLPKAVAAKRRLARINSEVEVEALVDDITADGIESLVRETDLILDATDNFETRYILNDACVKHQKPWIYSGVIAAYGVTMNIIPGQTACLRCAFPELPPPGATPTCDTAGVLNGIVGAITGIVSTEALKIVLNSDKVSRDMTWLDLWENTFERIEIPRQPDCPACGEQRFTFLDARGTSSTSLCGRNAVQVRNTNPGQPVKLNFVELAERLQPIGEVQYNNYLLRFQVDGYEFTVFPDARAIIKGTDDQQVARSVYTRYIGM
ncbi:thiamine/molybdopterin biosynthesis protein MoeB [Dictyobacter alpinus]|uniref:Thiamine/molybdopterin biosynthesis protein MoeB n=1 Tax=Dictyobacter alpinus TaxID=2014873 RepID=A0A402B9L1_9CHLR|nr:ThiF family adenylyltransferase [Dictyobacter alpinus]GCE27992.1 thiamine/molybdopterin biosynthesis protein MoeB [Dictyobacter alpinus]